MTECCSFCFAIDICTGICICILHIPYATVAGWLRLYMQDTTVGENLFCTYLQVGNRQSGNDSAVARVAVARCGNAAVCERKLFPCYFYCSTFSMSNCRGGEWNAVFIKGTL